MKRYTWLVLLIIGIISVYIYTRGAGAGRTESEAKTLGPAAGTGLIRISDAQADDAAATRSARDILLVDVIADKIAKYGISSPEVADLVSTSASACFAYFDRVKKDSKVTGWANDYLASACQGFDGSRYPGLQDPAPDFLEISILGGQIAVEEAALSYLQRPTSVFAALQAGTLLIGSGKLPEQESYKLSAEQLSRALAAANASTMCPGQNGCAAAQVLAASTCVDMACPVGISYESALLRSLSPAELEASNRLKKWLISIRK